MLDKDNKMLDIINGGDSIGSSSLCSMGIGAY